MLLQMAGFPSFLRLNNCINITHFLKIHLSVDGHLGCFHILAVVNNAAMDEHGSADIASNTDFYSFEEVARSGIAGSYDSSSFNVCGGTSYCFP